jgi:hypothetical protein
MRALKTLLILSHRYIGIPLSFMFVMWFVSGFFMIYTGGMPEVTPAMQVEGAAALNFAQIRLSPVDAANIAGYEPPTASLRTVLGRPVYVLGDPGYDDTFVFADDGELMQPLDQQQGAALASQFLAIPLEQFRFEQTLTEHTDQWTFTVRDELPLHKFVVNDGRGTQVYVSASRAVVSAFTTTQSRTLAWLGTIPHWLYFEGLRDNQSLWTQLIVWSSALGCVAAILGLLLGFTQFRPVQPFELKRAIPYQGLMRWHYILGCVFGVITLTWMFSGLLSMEPWAWTRAEGVRVSRSTLAASELKLQEFPALATMDWQRFSRYPLKQIEFSRVLGKPYLVAAFTPTAAAAGKRDRLHQPYNINGQLQARAIVVDAISGEEQSGFAPAALTATLDSAITEASVTDYVVLDAYDDYYYSRDNQLPLPVLRVKFDDENASWLYVDPARGELLSVVHRWSRVERWLYSGLHSLDFAFWYHKRPLWDIGVLLLLSGGLATSVLGLYFGVRRLKSDIVTLIHKWFRKKSAEGISHVA